jgi:hypothetical protein
VERDLTHDAVSLQVRRVIYLRLLFWKLLFHLVALLGSLPSSWLQFRLGFLKNWVIYYTLIIYLIKILLGRSILSL